MQNMRFQDKHKSKSIPSISDYHKKPLVGYIDGADLKRMQKIKDLLYRKYDIDRLERDLARTQIKDVLDFHDTNVEDSRKTIKLLRAEQNRIMKVKNT